MSKRATKLNPALSTYLRPLGSKPNILVRKLKYSFIDFAQNVNHIDLVCIISFIYLSATTLSNLTLFLTLL